MAIVRSILCDDRSAIMMRHAAIMSMVAGIGVAAGIFLTVMGSQLYERNSHRVLWAQVEHTGVV